MFDTATKCLGSATSTKDAIGDLENIFQSVYIPLPKQSIFCAGLDAMEVYKSRCERHSITRVANLKVAK